MSTEIYSLSNDFTNGLDNYVLLTIINSSVVMTGPCTRVRTDGDNVFIDFDYVLDNVDKIELDNIISNYVYTEPETEVSSNNFVIDGVLNKACSYSLSNKTVTSGADIHLTGPYGHTIGNLEGFDSGTYTVPATGMYFYHMYVNVQDTTTNATYKLILKDGNDDIINSKNAMCPAGYNNWSDFIGGGSLFVTGNKIKLYINFPTSTNVVDIVFKIGQLVEGVI